MGKVHGAAQFRNVPSHTIKVFSELGGSGELRVQLSPQVIELIFDNGENVGARHFRSGSPTRTPWSCGPAYASRTSGSG